MEYDKKDILEYIVAVVSEFSKRHDIAELAAFQYLRNFSGINFINECYASLHTDNLEYALNDIDAICRRNGGRL